MNSHCFLVIVIINIKTMRRFKTRIVFVLFICSIITVSMLFYFMLIFDDKKLANNIINTSRSVIVVGFSELRNENLTLCETYEKKVKLKLVQMLENEHNDDGDDDVNENYLENFVESLKSDSQRMDSSNSTALNLESKELKKIWSIAKKWVRARQIIPEKAPELSSIIEALQHSKIIKSDVSRKGTQLKLLLTLEGGQQALFKPRRYSRDYITDDIYAGADRHNGEIVAFHLSRILNQRYAPIVASRIINVAHEIKPVASPSLLATFVPQKTKLNKTLECFYGECYYCNEYELLCPDETTGTLEGAIILMLPSQYQLQKLRHPWQRTYKKNLKAQWEMDSHYCLSVLKSNSLRPRVLDFVDTAIFDYLIGNADRHHFEVFKDVSNSALLLIDNGKSFGDPSHDETTIIFPLLQCCVIRNQTYQHLRRFAFTINSSRFTLSAIIKQLLSNDQLWPLLTEHHLQALDRRLRMIMATIELCFETYQRNYVLKN
ncbi:glycosaminoglycan xylosylkinase-like protein [Euroglyphus maynei]|uniref:Glycosaminoglycan xylosylkinase-like protein n=1 Tax=Euroglyphus maynei TaxID=6958 RepID=A0A1Y3B2B0_EURMA|nr:glycosaminoglycan xylosylkinase-like protein [Euroglyphus maynei]